MNSPISPLPELAASEHDKIVDDAGLGTLVHVAVPVAPELIDDPVLETVELERVEVTELDVVDELVGSIKELGVADDELDTVEELEESADVLVAVDELEDTVEELSTDEVEVEEAELEDELEEVSVEDELVVTDELLDTEDELDVEDLETVELEDDVELLETVELDAVELETTPTLCAKFLFGEYVSPVAFAADRKEHLPKVAFSSPSLGSAWPFATYQYEAPVQPDLRLHSVKHSVSLRSWTSTPAVIESRPQNILYCTLPEVKIVSFQ